MVKLCRSAALYQVFSQTVVRTALPSHHLCAMKCVLPSNVASSTSILSQENCISLSPSILSGTYTYSFSTNLSKTFFATALSILWTVFIPTVWFAALNNCTKFSDLVAWCKARPSPICFGVNFFVIWITIYYVLGNAADSPLSITVFQWILHWALQNINAPKEKT